ncbi:MAG: NosD domain-containing protein [Candidatus Thermoplasmatota archaeon]
MKRILTVWLVIIILMGGMLVLVNLSTDADVGNEKAETRSASQSKSGLTVHDPIHIDGDSDFASQAATEGWVGNGTESNPYIIENYDINASTADGIKIEISYVHFIIRNCVIHEGKNNYKDGVTLWYVTNGKIQNVTFYNTYSAIRTGFSSNIRINNCACYNNFDGFLLFTSRSTIISNCTISNNRLGVALYSSSNSTLRNNIFLNNTYNFDVWNMDPNGIIEGWNILHFYQDIDLSNTVDGKPIYYVVGKNNLTFDGNVLRVGFLGLISCKNITVTGFNMYGNGRGILLANTTYSKVLNCTFTGNRNAIYIGASSNNTIRGCKVFSNANGVWFYYSSDYNIVANCLIDNNSYKGIAFSRSSNNTITNCSISKNSDGISFWYSLNNTVTNCNICLNNQSGIYLCSSSSGNIIYHNNFINNINYQAYDWCSNFWDNGTVGNYWSDYVGSDTDSDGIVDTPYNIPGDTNKDRYPLAQPLNIVVEINLPPTPVTLDIPASVTTTSMKLSWSRNNDADFANYTIYQSTTQGELGNPIKVITAKEITTFIVTGLTPNATYYFTVRVYNTDGYYSDSGQVSGKTLEEEIVIPAKPPELPWLYIIIPVVIIVVLATAVFGIRRRKKALPPEKPTE